jgi:hypothetical protein
MGSARAFVKRLGYNLPVEVQLTFAGYHVCLEYLAKAAVHASLQDPVQIEASTSTSDDKIYPSPSKSVLPGPPAAVLLNQVRGGLLRLHMTCCCSLPVIHKY